jgi:uncharacterized protein with LGFP repeats
VRFERGSIYRQFGGATRMVLGRADRRHRKLGGPRGRLGYPTSNTRDAAGGSGKVTHFQRGAIFVSPRTEPVEVTGSVLRVLKDLGGPVRSGLGFPLSLARTLSSGAYRQRFEHGVIIGPSRRRVYAVRGAIRDRWMGEMDGPAGPWGYAITSTGEIDGRGGLWNRFERGVVYWSPDTGVQWFARGPIYRRYRNEGGAGGWLGFPTADQTTAQGHQRVTFQHGTIVYDTQTGDITVERGS